MCELLGCQDNRIVTVALEGLENILKAGETEREMGRSAENPFAKVVDECGGLDKIEDLQQHSLDEIYDKAYKIIAKYFGEEGEDNALAPQVNDAGGYSFGAVQGAPGAFQF